MNGTKLAIFLPTAEGGGAEASMLRLANNLTQLGYSVDLLLKKKQGELLNKVEPDIKIVDFDVSSMRHTISKLADYYREAQPSVVLSALDLANLSALIARLLVSKKPKLIISIRGLISKRRYFPLKIIDQLLFGVFYRLADRIVCVSNICAKDAESYLRLPGQLLAAVYNPVLSKDLKSLQRETMELSWFSDPSAQKLVTIGRLESVKDHKTLIQAFHQVRKTRQAKLLILGEGSLREELSHLIQDLDLQEDVLLPGYVANPFPYLAVSDVFILSSVHEASPSVVIEALASNCPVVSTQNIGAEELLGHGKYGHLVPIGDAQAMADAIIRVLMGETKHVPAEWLSNFTVEHSTERYRSIIDDVLAT